jgi:hypothetical protein
MKSKTPTPREPASQMGSIVPHSAQAAVRSRTYHENTVEKPPKPKATMSNGKANPRKAVARLNPNASVDRANKTGRSFPGL